MGVVEGRRGNGVVGPLGDCLQHRVIDIKQEVSSGAR